MSLTGTSGGYPGYLDPFLGAVAGPLRRPRGVVRGGGHAARDGLGERPLWGDGQANPLTGPKAELYVAT